MSRLPIRAVGGAVLLAGLLVHAQDSSTPVFRSGARLVQVDVVVRDKKGPVASLKQNDFVIHDCVNRQIRPLGPLGPGRPTQACKGKVQPIQVFRESTPQRVPPPSGNAAGVVSNRPDSGGNAVTTATVLLLDQLDTPFDNKGYERKKVVQFLRTLSPDQHVAVYSLGRDLHLLLDFSADPKALVDAITKVDSGDLFPDYDPSDSPATARPTLVTGSLVRLVYRELKNRIALQAVDKILQHLSGVPGRKNLVWVGMSEAISWDMFNRFADSNVALYPVLVRSLGTSGVFSQQFTAGGGVPLGGTLELQEAQNCSIGPLIWPFGRLRSRRPIRIRFSQRSIARSIRVASA